MQGDRLAGNRRGEGNQIARRGTGERLAQGDDVIVGVPRVRVVIRVHFPMGRSGRFGGESRFDPSPRAGSHGQKGARFELFRPKTAVSRVLFHGVLFPWFVLKPRRRD